MDFAENLDELENKFNRFTITLEEFLDAGMRLASDPSVPAPVADEILNLLTGMKSYSQASGSEVCETIEEMVREVYAREKLMQG
jgi:hypothetical protein